jgi:hypothetical protein
MENPGSHGRTARMHKSAPWEDGPRREKVIQGSLLIGRRPARRRDHNWMYRGVWRTSSRSRARSSRWSSPWRSDTCPDSAEF